MTTGVPILAFDAIDSTMLEAARQADRGARGPLLVWSRAQTGGRGRHGRVWASPPGNLYWTMLLHAPEGRSRDAGLSFAAGLAVLDALEETGVPARRLALKWPNDALVDGRKVAGVLVQADFVAGSATRLIVGIGVNVATAPAATAFPATSLHDAGFGPVAMETLRDTLTRHFMRRQQAWAIGGLPALRECVRRRLWGVGATVRVALDRDRQICLDGLSEGIDDTGALLLRLADGTLRSIAAGDVLA